LLLVVFRGHIAFLFNNDPRVVSMVRDVAIWVAAFQVRF
jgi:Na+-driven multidrug efflux pump